jgi:hypothetical protein
MVPGTTGPTARACSPPRSPATPNGVTDNRGSLFTPVDGGQVQAEATGPEVASAAATP